LDASTNAGGVSQRTVNIKKNGLTDGGSEVIGKTNFMTPGGSGIQQQSSLPTPSFKNETQANAFGFANRIQQQQSTLNNLEDKFSDLSLTDQVLMTNPNVPNYLKSDDAQSLDQASRDFINAVLRRES
jgi:hypothetical protein